jgi:chorismate lyase/3-hydroxybenzoate synthase
MSSADRAAFTVAYHAQDTDSPPAPNVLARFDFSRDPAPSPDPRRVHVDLQPLDASVASECWSVAAPVETGASGELRWSAGGGWRLTVVEINTAETGDFEATSERGYRLLLDHVAASPERDLLRVWNYLGAINEGDADHERYRLFCNGRARAMDAHGLRQYPAATAIGHQGPRCLLQLYALSASAPGRALENPRQVSSWLYPRRYGPTAPGFARAMCLPDGALAISGTAAVVGHVSHHVGNVAAQAEEAYANVAALLKRARLPAFDAHSPLKVYVRRPQDADVVRAALARHLDPAVPRVVLQGDVCRRELLVEIEGWRFTPAA